MLLKFGMNWLHKCIAPADILQIYADILTHLGDVQEIFDTLLKLLTSGWGGLITNVVHFSTTDHLGKKILILSKSTGESRHFETNRGGAPLNFQLAWRACNVPQGHVDVNVMFMSCRCHDYVMFFKLVFAPCLIN